MRQVFLAFVFLIAGLTGAPGQQALTGLARLVGDGAVLVERRGRIELSIAMSQPVPWRVFTLDDPARVVLDFSELDWTGADPDALAGEAERIDALAVGLYRPGWSRMVLELARPMAVTSAAMQTGPDGAVLRLRLGDTDAESFAAKAGAPPSAVFRTTEGAALPGEEGDAQGGAGPLRVVLDPGHGGIDPGAERGGVREKDLMLTFARELKEVLLRGGNVEVILTRESDVFVPLETRVSIARRARADVFISLHADALAEGRAHGATVYTLADEASDEASAKLAERHDRADLLAGVDLSQTDDAVAMVLMDMARTETAPRSEALAADLVEGIYAATQSTYKTPRMQAGFSVLKAPDIPSVLIELGFLSSPSDRKKLTDPNWRRQAALGIRDALLYWTIQDAATATRLRK